MQAPTPLNIHFLDKLRKMRPVERGGTTYESGDWTITPERAARLKGAMAYFHETKTTPSYFGGKILDFRVIPAGKRNAGKVVFVFERMQESIGVTTGRDQWKLDQKLAPQLASADS